MEVDIVDEAGVAGDPLQGSVDHVLHHRGQGHPRRQQQPGQHHDGDNHAPRPGTDTPEEFRVLDRHARRTIRLLRLPCHGVMACRSEAGAPKDPWQNQTVAAGRGASAAGYRLTAGFCSRAISFWALSSLSCKASARVRASASCAWSWTVSALAFSN